MAAEPPSRPALGSGTSWRLRARPRLICNACLIVVREGLRWVCDSAVAEICEGPWALISLSTLGGVLQSGHCRLRTLLTLVAGALVEAKACQVQ